MILKSKIAENIRYSFDSKDELNKYLEELEEAKNRDHNKLGREMELFTTVDVIGQGLPLLMPKGQKMVRNYRDGLKTWKIMNGVMYVQRRL